MYLNGLCKPLQEVLQIHAKKINFSSFYFSQYIVYQLVKMEGCNAN